MASDTDRARRASVMLAECLAKMPAADHFMQVTMGRGAMVGLINDLCDLAAEVESLRRDHDAFEAEVVREETGPEDDAETFRGYLARSPSSAVHALAFDLRQRAADHLAALLDDPLGRVVAHAMAAVDWEAAAAEAIGAALGAKERKP